MSQDSLSPCHDCPGYKDHCSVITNLIENIFIAVLEAESLEEAHIKILGGQVGKED